MSIKTHLVFSCLPMAARKLSKISSAAVRASELELDDDTSVTHEIMGRKGETNGDKSICRTLKDFQTESEALTSF